MNIAFENVTFSYKKDEPPIVRDLSFVASTGDRMVLTGSSGVGKSTVFRLLLTFEQPQHGQIKINDQQFNIETLHNLRPLTSWLPQDLDLGTGEVKTLFYRPFEFKINAGNRPSEESVLQTLEALGLPQKCWKDKFENISTGQRQRIGIAICHHLNKPIMLLDEPTSALDDESKEKVKALLFADKERLILSTSHDPWWIKQCEQVIELDK